MLFVRKKKVVVFGLGYVGLSYAKAFIEKGWNVVGVDIDDKKSGVLPSVVKTYDNFQDVNFCLVAVPTNYHQESHAFDISSVVSVIQNIRLHDKKVPIVIKSTIPIGFSKKFNDRNLFFSPEFLREGSPMEDIAKPSRIVFSPLGRHSYALAKHFKSLSKEHCPLHIVSYDTAEAIKLFSNAYLAMRVAFFNEMDLYTLMSDSDISVRSMVVALSDDPRIGKGYNNPSFGYGGYCLPKDTKQLLSTFKSVGMEGSLMNGIVQSNQERKELIAQNILSLGKKKIGFYRLIMKSGSDNFREAAITDIIEIVRKHAGVEVIVYEPLLNDPHTPLMLENDFDRFINGVDVVVANRIDQKLMPFKSKVYTRDIFGVL